jgi:putative oxygen-independent coproporphyrinogen III oxidase
MKKIISVYIHWPFCKSKCPYCDFNSHVRDVIEIDKWNKAYLTEIENNRKNLEGRNIVSIFFGGGTPSLMPSFIIANIIDKLASIASIDSKTEITFEANPTSVESKKFQEFALAGINRVSLGIQSFNDQDLKFLGREHSVNEAISAIEIAKKYFKRYSFDLIYALPNQNLKTWENELTSAIKIADKHLSLYQLTIEKGTPFYSLYSKKKFTIPGENLAKDFYMLTQTIMNEVGLPAYEISNHAAINEECRHNLAYWKYDEFIGIGPGAHGRVNSYAIHSIYHPENWLNAVLENKSTAQSTSLLTSNDKICEMLLMGLRLNKGINQMDFFTKTGSDFDYFSQNKLKWMLTNDFLKLENDFLFTTNRGKLVLNTIIDQLLDNK